MQALPAGAPPEGRRELKKVVTRKDLIRAARRRFAQRGLHASRVEEITGDAGIAKGTMYAYFPGKEALIQEVVSTGFADLGLCMDERAGDAAGLASITARLVEAHLEFFTANPDLMRIFHDVRGMLKSNAPRWRPLRRPLSGHVEKMAGLLIAAEPRRPLAPDQARRTATLLFGAVSGVASLRLSLEPGSPLEPPRPALTSALVAMVTDYAARMRRRDRFRRKE